MERERKCLRPSTIMGQELIKSTVDASVFVINLTPALIRFVMTAVLAPPPPSNDRRTSSGGGGQWSAANIHHNPSITSVMIQPVLLYLGCGDRARLRGVALHTNPDTPISTCLGGHFNSLRHSRDLPWKAWGKVTADTAVIQKDFFKMSARR